MSRTVSLGASRFALIATLGLPALVGTAAAQDWKLVKPSTCGIPGEEIRVVRFAPDGLLWIGARWPFWSEGGFGVFDRNANLWNVHSNVDGPMPSQFPNDIAYAPGGVTWIATDAGLVKKIGQTWIVYTTANSPLLHNVIRSLDVDAQGRVWMVNAQPGTNVAALFLFDGVAWYSYQVGIQLPWSPPWKALTDVLVDHLGHVWVANDVLNGVAEYDGVQWKLHGTNVDRFAEIREDKAGNIWLRAGVGGANAFYKFDHATFTTYPINTTPTSIGIDDDGAVFLGDWNGTIRKTTNGGQNWTVFASGLNHVFEIEPAPDSTDLWIGTQTAVGHFNGSGALLDDYNTINTGMPDYFVDRFDLDADGNLWLATGEGGLSRFDGLRWRNWGNHNLGAEPYPFAGNEPMGGYHLDASGTGWMGGNGIARWNPQTGAFDGFWNWQNNPGMGVDLFIDFAEDKNGALFAIAKYGGVLRFNPSTQLWVKQPVTPYAPVGVPGAATDSKGNLWVAAWFELHRWDGVTWTTIGDDWGLFDLGGVNAIAIGPDDAIWLGTPEGLVRHEGASTQVFTPGNSPLPVAAVQSIDFRADGVMGLSASQFGSLTPFPNAVAVVAGEFMNPASWSVWHYGSSPLPHYQLGAVKFDGRGNLWVSAVSEGVAVILNPAQPLAVDRVSVSASDGGAVEMALDAGPAYGNRLYLVLASVSGTSPGTPVPGGQVLPLQWDVFTDAALQLVNTPMFAGFFGGLDATGASTATLDTLGSVPAALAGLEIHLAFAVVPSFGFVSNPVTIAILP